ncbi:hypothetical protein LZ31DRAFT_558121 [Colletotrichum somersetense]|nr:hypothetical protein LZ31DRAFT_558121 [Colletotrichum somersetense]
MRLQTALITIAVIAMQAIGIAATEVTILHDGIRISWVHVRPGHTKRVNLREVWYTVSVSADGKTASISGDIYSVEIQES